MQGGPRRGRSPITGPTLPRAAQASQLSPKGEIVCPQGSKNQRMIPAGEAKTRAAQAPQTSPDGETQCRRTAKLIFPTPGGENARRAGVPNLAGRRNSVPAGQPLQLIQRTQRRRQLTKTVDKRHILAVVHGARHQRHSGLVQGLLQGGQKLGGTFNGLFRVFRG